MLISNSFVQDSDDEDEVTQEELEAQKKRDEEEKKEKEEQKSKKISDRALFIKLILRDLIICLFRKGD